MEELHKGFARASGTATAEHLELGYNKVEFAKIGYEVLQPKAGALSYGGRCSGLIMCVAQRGHRLFLLCKICQEFDNSEQFATDELQGIADIQDIGVIRDITRGGAEVDDTGSRFGLLAESIHVSHYIVSNLFFARVSDIIIDVINILLHFGDLFVGDVEPQRFLSFC